MSSVRAAGDDTYCATWTIAVDLSFRSHAISGKIRFFSLAEPRSAESFFVYSCFLPVPLARKGRIRFRGVWEKEIR